MQFEINVGTDYSTVTLNGTLKLDVFEVLIDHFERLGGVMIGPKASDWTFPSYITSEVIEEVIRNTCFVCGGLMKDGQAIQEGKISVSSFDSIMDTYQGEIEYPNPQESRIIKVRKCSSCGHSHT